MDEPSMILYYKWKDKVEILCHKKTHLFMNEKFHMALTLKT